jgi:hypothetical protein
MSGWVRNFISDGKKVKQGEKRARGQQARRDQTQIPHVMLGGIEHKSCAHCAKLKTLDSFNRRTMAKDGLDHHCKECEKARRL